MLTAGRARGGKPGTGPGIRSVRLTLGRLRAALNMAVRRQLVPRNVAQYVTIPRHAREAAAAAKARRVPWTDQEIVPFLRHIATDRLYAPMLPGLRPAEVCGPRWIDVDLNAGTITVAKTRTNVEREAVEKAPKTEADKRTLPLPHVVLAAWAGRSDLSFTKRVHVHPNVEHLRPATERMDEVLRRR
ncbi:site-specific integrase [Streptomyces specialis]|uniref:hypothetical protein n=1 Tax=Streptomyces specialis TaxID=498367 RepID=UPI00073F5C73|nr:hypothetical protein [Streptomyces specialis]